MGGVQRSHCSVVAEASDGVVDYVRKGNAEMMIRTIRVLFFVTGLAVLFFGTMGAANIDLQWYAVV